MRAFLSTERWIAPLLLVACAAESRPDGPAQADVGVTLVPAEGTGTDTGEDGEAGAASSGAVRLDVLGGTGALDCPEGYECEGECKRPVHTPCDTEPGQFDAAIGLNCPGEPGGGTLFLSGQPEAFGLRSTFGRLGTWDPREGQQFLVVGTGFVGELDERTPFNDDDEDPRFCNDVFSPVPVLGGLPEPLEPVDVRGDCTVDPTLVGTGDCSNTIEEQFVQGGRAYDYAEVRIEATVPEGTNSFSYEFAFFSTEYPVYFGEAYNDMYVGWLESENWTGNVSFDESGQPISLNAGFLDYRDDGGDRHPEFDDTCMERHAGTRWLQTTAPVTPGETITLVLAIFDLADANLDSYVFIDNFRWGCDGTEGPTTRPIG